MIRPGGSSKAAAIVAMLLVATTMVASAAGPVHHVVGSGIVAEDGIAFRTSVSARYGADGIVDGTIELNLDLSAFDLGLTNVVSRVTCLHVSGNRAWIGAVAIASSNADIIPAGTYTITMIADSGALAPDLMHGEVFDPSVSCESAPQLIESVISNGNYIVR